MKTVNNLILTLLVVVVHLAPINKIDAQVNIGDYIYGDLIMTPMMAYTINKKGSNIPTHFLTANGVKANIGFEIGALYSVYTTNSESRAFLIAGMSRHFLGFDYGSNRVITLNDNGVRISNHRHSRYFFGLKFIPFERMPYFSLSGTAGLGNISANYASKNVNGKIVARTGDVSFSFSFGLNRFVFE